MYTADQRMANLDRFYANRVEAMVTLVEHDKKDAIKKAISAEITAKIDEIFELVPQTRKDKAEGALLKTGIDNVSLRVNTFNSIIDSLTQHLKAKVVDESFFKAGIHSGIEFANELFNYFLEKRSIPGDYETFIAFWMKYDSSAGFGLFSVEDEDLRNGGYIKIRTKDSFMVRGYTLKTHRYCKFVEGYIHGLLYEGFQRLCRTLEFGGYLPPKFRLYPITSSHTQADQSTCSFTLNLKVEELTEAHSSLFWANGAFKLGVYRDTILRSRSALEKAVKEKLGIPTNSFDSFYRLTSTLFSKERGLDPQKLYTTVNAVKDVYATASKYVHEDNAQPRLEVAKQILDTATLFLFSLDHADFTETQRKDAHNRLAKGPESRVEILNEIEHRKELRLIMKKNLDETEKKAAKYGIDVPLKIFHEQEDFIKKIKGLDNQIEELKKHLNE